MDPKIPDSHLQNAIRKHERDLLIKGLANRASRYPQYKVPKLFHKEAYSYPRNQPTPKMHSEFIYGVLLAEVHTCMDYKNPNLTTLLENIWEAIRVYVKDHYPLDTHVLIPTETTRRLSPRAIGSYIYKELWEDIRCMMQHEKRSRSYTWVPVKLYQFPLQNILITGHFMTFDYEGSRYVFDYQQVMMICDTITARVMCLLYMEVLPENADEKIPLNVLERIYTIFDNLLVKDGNLAYNEIKNMEPIIISCILEGFDPLSYSSKFVDAIMEEFAEEEMHSCIMMREYLVGLHLSAEQLSELHGIYRHWGHPTVDEEEGCEKVKEIAHNRPVPDYNLCVQLDGMFTKQFCISFLGIHGRLPSMQIPEKLETKPLGQAILSGKTNFNMNSTQYPLEDWAMIVFNKEFDFDFYEDFTELCDDKSLGIPRTYLRQVYCSDLLGYVPPMSKESRRVLLAILSRTKLSIKDICTMIMNRNIPDAWKMILVHAKEREIKIKPRLFAMMVLEMRLYFIVTEKNISEIIFKYFPQQTMTMNENELTRRLFGMSSKQVSERYIPVMASIDFKSWNIHWQYLSTLHVFDKVDQLFGTKGLLTYTHIFFQECWIALSSHFNPPSTLIDNPQGKIDFGGTIWKDHHGGLEGLRQKGWTLVTIIMLLYCEHLTGVRMMIVGQGDNQVCKLYIRRNEFDSSPTLYIQQNQDDLSESIESCLSQLRDIASGLGLQIKLEESYVSSNYLCYGKDHILDGAMMSSQIKRISRAMTDVNEIFPTCTAKVATIDTTGISASMKGLNIVTPFMICKLEILICMVRETRYSLIIGKSRHKMDGDIVRETTFMSFILHLSSEFGDFPIQGMLAYMYRGHPDPLTTYLTERFIGQKNQCSYCIKILEFLESDMLPIGEGNPELLISNPCSLNIKSPTPLGTKLKHYMRQFLKDNTRNIYLRQIFHANFIEEDQGFYHYLIQTEPIYPRVLHELFLNSTTGIRLQFIARFDHTRTIQQLSIKGEQAKFFSSVVRSDNEMFTYWESLYRIITSLPGRVAIQCPTQLAHLLRNKTWKATAPSGIHGVTIPHPYHQFTMEFPLLNTDSNRRPCGDFDEGLLFNIGDLSIDINRTRGSYAPFLGSQTKEKIIGKILQMPTRGRPIKAAERLVQLRSWCVAEQSKFFEYINQLISLRTDTPMTMLELASGQISSGSHTHRLNDHVTSRSASNNIRPNATTHIYISTDNAGRFSRGSDNYNMHFQGAILTGIWALSSIWYYLFGNKKLDQFSPLILVYSGSCCEEKILDVKMINESPYPVCPIRPDNPLLFTPAGEQHDQLKPGTRGLFMTDVTDPSYAVAYLMLDNIVNSLTMMKYQIYSENPALTPYLSVQDFISIDISSMLTNLAMLLYLCYYPYRKTLHQMISLVPSSIWRDLMPLFLLPELLPKLVQQEGFVNVPEIFCNNDHLCRVLSMMIVARLKYVVNEPFPYFNNWNHPFFLTKHISIIRVLCMWNTRIKILYPGIRSITESNPLTFFKTKLSHNLPQEDEIFNYLNEVLAENNLTLMCDLLLNHPLKISKNPPEICIRRLKYMKRPSIRQVHELPIYARDYNYEVSNYVQSYETPLGGIRTEDVHPKLDQVSFATRLRDYEDHEYHLWGELTSSFLKILEIIINENIHVLGEIVCLADGEGSISLLLLKMGAHNLYFNTLVNQNKLIPQRGVHYCPSLLVPYKDKVKLANLSALLGGDINDNRFLDEFISGLPGSIEIMTFDAESPVPFTNSQYYQFILSIFKILNARDVQKVIMKIYLNSPDFAAWVLSKFSTKYLHVKYIVPIYSSNETKEYYLYAHELIRNLPVTPADSIVVGYQNHILYMDNLIKSRLSINPHQSLSGRWLELGAIAEKLKFPMNIISELNHMTSFINPITKDTIYTDWLEETNKLALKYAYQEIRGFGLSSAGLEIPLHIRNVMSKSSITSHVIDLYCDMFLSTKICKEMLKLPHSADLSKTIDSVLARGCLLKHNDKVIYKYYPTPYNWNTLILKSLRRIWGYIKYVAQNPKVGLFHIKKK